jgi:hypothetical protein
MSPTSTKTEAPQTKPPPRKEKWYLAAYFPWKRFLVTAALMALTGLYLIVLAPPLVPVPAGVRMPFPEMTHFLEKVCVWCGHNPGHVFLIGLAFLGVGFFFRVSAGRYYIFLTIVLSFGLGVTYYSISAPIDRLIKSVEDNLPRDNRVPAVNNPSSAPK